MWQAHSLDERTIPPLETREAVYRLDLAKAPASATLKVRVRLLFRAFPPHQLEILGIGDLRERFPVFVMQEHEARPIVVTETLRTPGVIRVPEDAASLADAVRTAESGDEISVAPGRYLVESPIDFRGKDVILRSREGAEVTVIERAPEVTDSDDGSLFRFASGETPAARVEGFTLRGGRGSQVDGARVGGAVIVLESDPLIAGNIFTDNRARDGGAIFLRNSFSHVRECRFSSNHAERNGGAIDVIGRSGVLLESSTFEENRAADGGAVHLGAGNTLLACRLERNRAFRGGGAFLRAGAEAVGNTEGTESADDESPPIHLRGNLLAANSSRQGGGIFLLGPGRFLLQRNILAGNLGGGLHAEGGARIEAPHTTLVDHRFGPSVRLAGNSRARFTSSILWGNRPSRLAGDIRFSLVDDETHAGGSNMEGFPIFRPPQSSWERCRGAEEEGCVPVIRESLEPEDPRYWRRYNLGSYRPLVTAPNVDRGDPDGLPDPDGSLPDPGALYAPKARKLFLRGDLDGDGRVDFDDARRLGEVLRGGPRISCPDAADLDDDGRLTTGDLSRLLSFLLHLAPRPPPPYPDCGSDSSPRDRLGCFEARCPATEG